MQLLQQRNTFTALLRSTSLKKRCSLILLGQAIAHSPLFSVFFPRCTRCICWCTEHESGFLVQTLVCRWQLSEKLKKRAGGNLRSLWKVLEVRSVFFFYIRYSQGHMPKKETFSMSEAEVSDDPFSQILLRIFSKSSYFPKSHRFQKSEDFRLLCLSAKVMQLTSNGFSVPGQRAKGKWRFSGLTRAGRAFSHMVFSKLRLMRY